MDRASVWVGISGQIGKAQGGEESRRDRQTDTRALDRPLPVSVAPAGPGCIRVWDSVLPTSPLPGQAPAYLQGLGPWEDGRAQTWALLFLCVRRILRPFVP